MHIDFNSSAGASLGIEVEFWLVDRDTRELAGQSTPILAEIGAGHPHGEHPKAKHELFECIVEIITGICTTTAEAKADLGATLAELGEAAARRNLAVCSSGAHPFSDWSSQTVSDNPRYHELVEEMAWMAERLLICGVHFHVGVKSPEKAVAIANAVSGYIPHLLALSASSPYWRGHDTGLASSRSKVFEGLPTAGLPEQITNWDEFETFMGTLVSAESIKTIREVWWDIRPHPDFGTVELRMSDAIPTLREIVSLAALGQSLVHHFDRLIDQGHSLPLPREWLLRQNKWRAARHGIGADLIVDESGTTRPLPDLVSELIAELEPVAADLSCSDELAGIGEILTAGPSYIRQRQIVGRGGRLTDVVDALVDELAEDRPRVLQGPAARPGGPRAGRQP